MLRKRLDDVSIMIAQFNNTKRDYFWKVFSEDEDSKQSENVPQQKERHRQVTKIKIFPNITNKSVHKFSTDYFSGNIKKDK